MYKRQVVYGHYELLMPDDPELYVYTREWNGEMLLVVCNFSDNERRFVFPEGLDAKKAELWIGNYPEAQAAYDLSLIHILILPHEMVIRGTTGKARV